jgi:TPR repeat protein
MGERLVPSLQVKNMIKILVKSGKIEVSKCTEWLEKLKFHKYIDGMKEKAKKGDKQAMLSLAECYRDGHHRLNTDFVQSCMWAKQAADLGYPRAKCFYGRCLLEGIGIQQDVQAGIGVLIEASMAGSQHACYLLGWGYKHGRFSIQQSDCIAKSWARSMTAATIKDSPQNCVDEAQTWLNM